MNNLNHLWKILEDLAHELTLGELRALVYEDKNQDLEVALLKAIAKLKKVQEV